MKAHFVVISGSIVLFCLLQEVLACHLFCFVHDDDCDNHQRMSVSSNRAITDRIHDNIPEVLKTCTEALVRHPETASSTAYAEVNSRKNTVLIYVLYRINEGCKKSDSEKDVVFCNALRICAWKVYGRQNSISDSNQPEEPKPSADEHIRMER